MPLRFGHVEEAAQEDRDTGDRRSRGHGLQAGDAIFVYKFHPSPSPRNRDADLARAIASVEAIGWTLLSQQAEGEGLQRFVSLSFRRAGA
ncbi:hypothetical protein C5746_06140 [Streptomyces atratus]|uniref:Uncharacterized protein n=1 Tax=Streptomyces atratus TaxID=1893 RepID=A0A2Z5J8B1_STRAR|nr:hypothetical protein C5746_06140 [Streptomyces atratus]